MYFYVKKTSSLKTVTAFRIQRVVVGPGGVHACVTTLVFHDL